MRDVREMSSAELQGELALSEGVDCPCSSGPESSMCDECRRVGLVLEVLFIRGDL